MNARNDIRPNTALGKASGRRDMPSTGLWAALVFLVSLNLRPSITSVGPLLERIGTDLSWGESVQGILTSIPLIAFAAVSPLVTFIERRIGADWSVFLALLCIAFGDFVRSYCGNVGIWLGTVIFASSIAVGNVLVPVIVKRDYAGHVAMATGIYSGCITAGSSIAGLIAVPLSQTLGDWKASLSFWSIPPLMVAALWLLRIAHNRNVMRSIRSVGEPERIGDAAVKTDSSESSESSKGMFLHVLRRPVTWYVTLFMGLQSSAFYTMSNWMPRVSTSEGFNTSVAGVHLFVFQSIGILAGLLIPKLMNVRGSQICAALTASTPMLVAGFGMLLFPKAMIAWAVIGGCAQGASLVVALALIAMRGRGSAETVVLSGVAQSLGYLIAAMGPLTFGVVVQLTGGCRASLVLFTFVAFLQCVFAILAGKTPKTH